MKYRVESTYPRTLVHCLECGDVVHIDTGDYYISSYAAEMARLDEADDATEQEADDEI